MFVKIVIHSGGKIRQYAAFQVRIIQIRMVNAYKYG